MYGYNQQLNLDRINQQINELERLKSGVQAMPQQPIQNIINTNPAQIQFEARYLKNNEKVEEILVQHKTAFIDEKNGYLKVKDIDGTITTYELVLPKDEKDLKIEELERRLKEYECSNDTTINKRKPKCNDTKFSEEQP